MKKESAEPSSTGGLPKILTSSEVARPLVVVPSTLCRWRAEGNGPRVYWLGVAAPRYREDDVRKSWSGCLRERPQAIQRSVARRLTSARQYVAGKTFDTRRDALGWLARERAALAGGVDHRAGRTPVRRSVPVWLEERKETVAQ